MIMVTAAQLVDIELGAATRHELLQRASEVVGFEWFGKRIAVHFDESAAAISFRSRYSAFLSSGPPDLVVCAVRSGNEAGEPVFWTEPGGACRYPAALNGDVIAFLADAVTHRAFFDVNPAIMSFHAAAVRVGDAAAAISAESTGGKSTTALACARRGMPLYTDERCVLINGSVHAFPRAVNVRKGGMDLLLAQNVQFDGGIGKRLQPHGGAHWESASFEEIFGKRALPEPAKLEVIFFIEGRAGVPHVAPVPRGDAIVRLLTAGFCGPQCGMDRVAAATALFQQTRVYALTLGSPDDTAQLIASTTNACESTVAVAS
jgi:hypothetical protein